MKFRNIQKIEGKVWEADKFEHVESVVWAAENDAVCCKFQASVPYWVKSSGKKESSKVWVLEMTIAWAFSFDDVSNISVTYKKIKLSSRYYDPQDMSDVFGDILIIEALLCFVPMMRSVVSSDFAQEIGMKQESYRICCQLDILIQLWMCGWWTSIVGVCANLSCASELSRACSVQEVEENVRESEKFEYVLSFLHLSWRQRRGLFWVHGNHVW